MKHLYILSLLATTLSFGQLSDTKQANSKNQDTYLGLDTIEQDPVRIYPNPVKGNVLYLDVRSLSSVEIFDVLGKRIINTQLGNASKYLDVSILKRGVYIIKIRTDSGTTTKKLIRQ